MKVLNLILLGLLVAFTAKAQPEDKYTRNGDLVLVERYYEDGSVRETGSYLNDLAHGKWVQYNQDGSIQIEANYINGKKEGKWFVWTADGKYLYEVVYQENSMKDSHRWKIEERNLLAGD